MPEFPDLSKMQDFGCQRIVAADRAFDTREIGPGEPKRMKGDKEVFFIVFCRLTYKDLSGTIHHTGFAVEVSPHMPVSSNYRNKNYEYYD